MKTVKKITKRFLVNAEISHRHHVILRMFCALETAHLGNTLRPVIEKLIEEEIEPALKKKYAIAINEKCEPVGLGADHA